MGALKKKKWRVDGGGSVSVSFGVGGHFVDGILAPGEVGRVVGGAWKHLPSHMVSRPAAAVAAAAAAAAAVVVTGSLWRSPDTKRRQIRARLRRSSHHTRNAPARGALPRSLARSLGAAACYQIGELIKGHLPPYLHCTTTAPPLPHHPLPSLFSLIFKGLPHRELLFHNNTNETESGSAV